VKKQIGNATLYLGDCAEILPTLGQFDAVVTDPPYGIGIDRKMAASSGKKTGGMYSKKGSYETFGWDDNPITKEATDLLRNISNWQIIFGGNYFELPPTKCWLLWDKEINGNFADAEMAWTNLNKPVKLKRYMWNGMLRANKEPRGDHPTQKPVGIMEWVISHLPAETQTIIDPYMGSGTTGVACAKMGKTFVGIEREQKYFDIACKRIEQAYAQGDMFI
jgi:site-specific DNA-methyltransferase (adenine-specific)/modification methylase